MHSLLSRFDHFRLTFAILTVEFQAAQIQSEWQGDAAEPPPHLDYIHGVINDEKRRTRLDMPEYQALDVLCQRDNGKCVMLYMVPDPELDPNDTSSDLPLGALHLVMCCTVPTPDKEVARKSFSCLSLGPFV